MARETASDDVVTVPPPAITVTSEVTLGEHPLPPPPSAATAFGVELADGAYGASRRAFLVVHQGYGPNVLEMNDGDSVSFGRSSSSTITVDDPRASRNHARIFREGPLLYCEDLGSRNGTKVNGASLRDQRRIVVSGDAIRIGICEVFVASAIAPSPDDEEGSIGVVVADAKMRDVFALAKQLASTDTSILVQGEAGVGKKVVAAQVHRWSPRSAGPLVRMDCTNLTDMSLEGALFGYEGGDGDAAGVLGREIGHLEGANGGTLLLDGVGELSAAGQAKLMAALESRTIVRLGGEARIPIDVRVLGATHRDLPAEVAGKRFREDLYYALSSFTVRVPPLRERAVEVDLFAHLFSMSFAARIGQLGAAPNPDAAAALAKYDWPGNVRELRGALRHAVAATHGGPITLGSLPDPLRRRLSVRMQVP
ncbi:MAG TPA: sigma 54-interacting transcriptional regulator [Polyangiaceae bacterium]|jgi:transcriptional regulator of acetoin/glycerol metabolism